MWLGFAMRDFSPAYLLSCVVEVMLNRSPRIALFIEKSNVGIDIWRQRPALDDFEWNMIGIHP